MIVLLSPAKTLDFTPAETPTTTLPRLLSESQQLVEVLKEKTPQDLQDLMKVSEKIATLNFERFHAFQTPFTTDNAKAAGLTFAGDVYTGFQADAFNQDDLTFAQAHVRILSGLYGVLRPLDLMQAYRLEMGTKLRHNGTKNLYEFWADKITQLINQDLEQSPTNWVVNLASKEYFSSVQPTLLKGKLLQVDFKEDRNGKLKTIAFYAKKARGAMAHQIVKQRIVEAEDLKTLLVEGYIFKDALSTAAHYVFVK